uniref:Uncharacterized protein n=1 Tax=Sphaerodactylus townsendi TaxID=933632 RepID=A0ACB8E958_9SAUR
MGRWPPVSSQSQSLQQCGKTDLGWMQPFLSAPKEVSMQNDASDYFREIGGLMFVNNLVKSSVYSIVKEAALFTLGGLAETSVFCQEILCTSGLFEDLRTFLTQRNSSVNLKRVSVYVLLVLVSNNTRLQQFFASIGGLAVLDELLAKLIYNSSGNLSSTKLAVAVTKTLDACIADNYAIGAALARYNIVPNLLTLLSYSMINSREKFSIILTLGHCTDGCEENQYVLVQNNGLPLMIQALTESQDEELNKAATFVLQNCKRITEKLSVKLSENSSSREDAGHLKADLQHREETIEDYRVKAKQILHRIQQLENEHQEVTNNILIKIADLQAKHDTFMEKQASKQKYNPENASLGEKHTYSFDDEMVSKRRGITGIQFCGPTHFRRDGQTLILLRNTASYRGVKRIQTCDTFAPR